jgi:hypothetical protein
MAYWKIGTFNGQATTGDQSITGLGGQPVALIIFRNQDSIATSADASMMIGAASGSSNQFVCGYRSRDNQADSDTRRFSYTDAIISVAPNNANAPVRQAALVSFDSDGFTINWSINNDGGTGSYTYIAFFAPVDVHVGSFSLNGSTGNQAITGVGFQPKVVLFLNSNNATGGYQDGASQMIGMATSSSARGVHSSFDEDAQATMDVQRSGSTSLCIQRIDDAGANVQAADFVSMDSDGFTINVSTTDGVQPTIGYVAIGGSGLSAKVDSITGRSTNGSTAYTGVGFTPALMMFAGFGFVASNSIFSGFGAATASDQGYIGSASENNVTTSNCARTYSSTNCIGYPLFAGSGVSMQAALTSFDADGFTLNFGTTDGAASNISYMALRYDEESTESYSRAAFNHSNRAFPKDDLARVFPHT